MNILTKTTALAMEVTLEYVQSGDFVVDSTCGNGYDTLALAEAVGLNGKVMALDLQQNALEATQTLLKKHGRDNVTFVNGNFRNLKLLTEKNFNGREPSAIVFNLGYLPGGDKTLTTEAGDSVEAVKQALEIVRVGGIVTIVLYSGHDEGRIEKKELLEMARSLPSKQYHAVYTNMLNQRKDPPEILWITKKG